MSLENKDAKIPIGQSSSIRERYDEEDDKSRFQVENIF